MFLIISIILFLISNIIEISSILVNFDSLSLENLRASDIYFNVLGIITAGLILLFFSYFENERIPALRLVIYLTAASNFIVSASNYIGVDNIDYNPDYGLLAEIANGLANVVLIPFLLYVAISCSNSISSVKNFVYDQTQLRQLNVLQGVIIFYYVNTVVLRTFSNVFFNNETLLFFFSSILPRISVIIGSILLLNAYAFSKRVAFLQPQRMHQLVIVNDFGLPLFSFNFRLKDQNRADEYLFSGGLTAINSLLKEAIDTTSDIKSIKFTDVEIMVNRRDNFGVFLIVDRPSNFIRNALVTFANEFANNYDTSGEIIEKNQFKGADNLVKKTFGLI
jgi:hypothetical protein